MNDDLSRIARDLDQLVAIQQRGVEDYVRLIAVLVTLCVITWYTIETYRLRKVAQDQTAETSKLLREAQRQNEVSDNLLQEAHLQNEVLVMPILAVAVEPVPGADTIRIALLNVGSGPAFNLTIDHIEWGNRQLQIEHGRTVLRTGQEDELIFHFKELESGSLLDAQALSLWLSAHRIPDPLEILVRCNSVSSRPYTFEFSCTSNGGKVQITYKGSESVV